MNFDSEWLLFTDYYYLCPPEHLSPDKIDIHIILNPIKFHI
jgi:hypothetical protein